MAIKNRKLSAGQIFHSDGGTHYAFDNFSNTLDSYKIVKNAAIWQQIMSEKNDGFEWGGTGWIIESITGNVLSSTLGADNLIFNFILGGLSFKSASSDIPSDTKDGSLPFYFLEYENNKIQQ